MGAPAPRLARRRRVTAARAALRQRSRQRAVAARADDEQVEALAARDRLLLRSFARGTAYAHP